MANDPPEKVMRDFLLGDYGTLQRLRAVFRRLPSSPHCKLCAVAFEGPGGALLGHIGFEGDERRTRCVSG